MFLRTSSYHNHPQPTTQRLLLLTLPMAIPPSNLRSVARHCCSTVSALFWISSAPGPGEGAPSPSYTNTYPLGTLANLVANQQSYSCGVYVRIWHREEETNLEDAWQWNQSTSKAPSCHGGICVAHGPCPPLINHQRISPSNLAIPGSYHVPNLDDLRERFLLAAVLHVYASVGTGRLVIGARNIPQLLGLFWGGGFRHGDTSKWRVLRENPI